MKRFAILLLILPAIGCAEEETRYLDTIPDFWRTIYPDGGEGLYCGERFERFDRRYNIEHVYPMAWVARELRCGDRQQCRRENRRFNAIESDMHNMYPARKDLNKARGSWPFREIKGERRVGGDCDLEINRQARAVEPRPEVRGDIARAMLYMADQHGLTIYARQRRDLERWHREDPPNDAERRRNNLIEAHQGRRNHWIDATEARR